MNRVRGLLVLVVLGLVAAGCYVDPPIDGVGTGGYGVLHAVRVGAHPDFDRIVFEFQNGVIPDYHLRYVNAPIREDPSDRIVAVAGTKFLQIVMMPASAWDPFAEELSYTGPNRLQAPGATVLKELVRTGDFEGYLTWTAGLSGTRKVEVSTLTAPARLVIDIAH